MEYRWGILMSAAAGFVSLGLVIILVALQARSPYGLVAVDVGVGLAGLGVVGLVLLTSPGVRTVPIRFLIWLRRSPHSGRRTGLERFVIAVLPLLALAAVVGDAVWRNPTEAAAVATALTIGYIAYQAWQTRRAADAAERGLETAERSMETTERSLQISQVMAAEAEKTRLDQRQLTIRVNLGEQQWPPLIGSQADSSVKVFEEGHIFRLPKNADDVVVLQVEGEVINEGTTTVDVELRNLCVQWQLPGATTYWSPPTNKRRHLAPGDKLCFRIEAARPVREWVANAHASENESLPHVTRAQVVVDDGFDNGVIDTWPLALSGTPLKPVPEEAESWQIHELIFDPIPIEAIRQPRRRTYWRSKERRLQLPSLEA